MAKEFLGHGWKFPVNTSPYGKIKMSEHEEDIKEAIWIILGTSKGERIMRPDFGCGIHDFVFDYINTTTLKMMEESVKEALILWEPRIEIITVKASPHEYEEGKILISIDYRVRNTNNQFNLVYPFYLMEGG
ncbi:GPW/gp25 family protein [Methanobacterium formicicum]|uniref:GPW/gp25 family protein n=1 Tax=Methanobacterium formicicum TaxID=2162 RepID=UPI002412C8CA|nr:GPW/gp25 family protein [Methanobacterium formicicum]MDG3548138.1 GPW/gp25 family protein [Methanobacterium formicicum]